MNFIIVGFEKYKGEFVYEQHFGIPVSDLMIVMQWNSSADYIGVDFPVLPAQAEQISRLASIKLPFNLNLYIGGYE